ncbi:sensor domain-containing protein [Spiribacter halobius]|nr:EAL domain-containing protein [Spiribacter halobius]UEX79003.1 EAL domain-containing protein [Spiribacter halobius]
MDQGQRLIRNDTEIGHASAVAASERRFRSLVAATSDFVWRCAPDGRLLEISAAWLELAGLSAEAARGWGWLPALHEADRQPYLDAWLEHIATGRPFTQTYRLLCAGGDVRWFQDRAVPVHDDTGTIVEWIGAGQDVTGRKLATMELERQREQYRTLVECTSAILWEGDPETFQFTFVSQEAETLLGYPTARWCQERDFWVRHIHPEDRDWAPDYCARTTAEGRSHTFDYRMLAADGSVVWLRDVVSVITEGGRPVKMVGVMVDITASKRTEIALRESEARLRAISSNLPGGLSRRVMEADGRVHFTYLSDGYAEVFGVDVERARRDPKALYEIMLPEDRPRYDAALRHSAAHREPLDVQFRIRRPDGALRWVRALGTPRPGDNGATVWDGLAIDDTHRREAEDALRESQALLEIAGRTARLGGWLADVATGTVSWSDEVCAIFDLPAGSHPTVAQSMTFFRGTESERVRTLFHRCVRDGRPYDEEFEILTARGRKAWVRVIGEPVHDTEGRVTHVRGACQDITEQRRAREAVQFLAHYDPLTRLPNRRLLHERLQLALAGRGPGARHAAVLFLDLDHFKTVNDTLGHQVGDRMLQEVARRLAASVRETDTVARFGGDEFAIILSGLDTDPEEALREAEAIGEGIRATLARPYHLEGHERHSSVSLGITLLDEDCAGADDLMQRADVAMYQAKAAGRGRLRLFDPGMRAALHNRVREESALREALAEARITVHYQAQFDAEGRVTGAEALARWHDPARGWIPPAEFIPLAEDCGLIGALGASILEQACEALARWQRQGHGRLTLAVNVSARQFHEVAFVDTVRDILHRTGASPWRLRLELTESLLLADVEDTSEKMHALRALGLRFALDDFGTGYSSLAYLRRLPFDQLKIHQGFVQAAQQDPNDDAIVRTVIALANTLGLEPLAEGVETEAQREMLAAYGCTACQGYLLGRPAPEAEFVARLDAEAAHPTE